MYRISQHESTANNYAGIRVMECQSLDDLIEAAEYAARNHRQAEETAVENVTRYSWIGRRDLTPENLYRMVRQGWPEGRAAMATMRDRLDNLIAPAGVGFRRKRRRDEFDGEVNTDRLFGMTDDVYDRTVRVQAPREDGEVTIVCGVVESGGYSHTELLWRAAAAVTLSDILESRGRRTRIVGTWRTTEQWENCRDRLLIGCWVKQAGQIVDSDAVMSALSAWAMRTLWFLATHAPNMKRRVRCGYGYGPYKVQPDELPLLGIRPDKDPVIHVDEALSAARAEQVVRTQIARLLPDAQEELAHA